MNISERLNKIIKSLGLTQSDFAESIGIKQPTLSKQLKGLHKIDKQEALAIKAVYNVDPNWLLTGEGEMFITHSDSKGTISDIAEFEKISRTKWFRIQPKEKKDIIAGLARVNDTGILKKVSALITAQAEKEKAEDKLKTEMEELKSPGKKKDKK